MKTPQSKPKTIIIACAGLAIAAATITLIILNNNRQNSHTVQGAHTITEPNIDLSSFAPNSIINITNPGEYFLTGTLKDGQIIIDTGTNQATLHLSGIDLTNPSGAAILVKNASQTTITLDEGTTNTITDGTIYSDPERAATIFSHDDLEIDGSGNLTINANYKNAIESRDDLKITGGHLTLTAINHALFGNNSITIQNANLSLNSRKDSIHTDGNLTIESGVITITSGDDALHADGNLTISNGNITVESCLEGIEGLNVLISGGTINVTTSDDGINGLRDIIISSGHLTVIAATDSGDGLDANHDLTITGGDITLKTPTTSQNYSPTDVKGTFTITGGRLRTLKPDGTYTDITK